MRALYTERRILNWILQLMGSQWSLYSDGGDVYETTYIAD